MTCQDPHARAFKRGHSLTLGDGSVHENDCPECLKVKVDFVLRDSLTVLCFGFKQTFRAHWGFYPKEER